MSLVTSSSRFKKRFSIRTKILLPFLVIVTLLGVSYVYLSFELISDHMEVQLMEEYLEKSLMVKETLENRFRSVIFYTNLITELNRETSALSGPGTLPPGVLERSGISIYWGPRELEAEQQQLYRELLDLATQGKNHISVFLKHAGEDVVVSIASVTLVNQVPVIVEKVLKDTELIGDIREFHPKLQGGYLYSGPYKDGTLSVVFSATPLILSQPELQTVLFSAMQEMKDSGVSPFVKRFRFEDKAYNLLMSRQDFNSHLFSVTLAPLNEVQAAKVEVIVGTLSFLLLITLVMVIIYVVIIRKITSSLDILSSVAEKVSQGDLDQHVYATTSDEVGELSEIFNQMIDNLKMSSASLIQEKNQSESIISAIPEGIIVTDTAQNVLVANNRVQDIFQRRADEMVGRNLLTIVEEQELNKLFEEMLSVLKKKRVLREVVIPDKHGKNRFYALTANSVKDPETDQPLGVVTVLRDITHDKELEALRESFLRTVSHELRTPLTSIIGFIDLVSGSEISEDQKRFLQIALDEAMSLKSLIDDLLDLSRIEAGKMKLIYTPIPVKELLDNMVQSLEPLTKGKQLKLVAKVTDPSLCIEADASKLRRVLVNLVSNAIKFTEKGTVSLDCRDMGDHVEFSVTDTGIGLMEDEKEVIFEKFRQIDYSSTRKYEGIGLGLSIVRQLVELHRGKVKVESEYGKGSRFFFTIPKVAPAA